jgi:predicted esterase YcpF (UPF0227 family)
LPWRFREAVALIDGVLRAISGQPICLVGSSLGGFYAAHFAEKYRLPAVLVNPAVKPYESLVKYLGPQRNLYSGEEYKLSAEHVHELIALDVPRITAPERYLLLTRTGDEVLDYREGTEKFVWAHQVVIEGGDHAFSDFATYVDRIIAFADRRAAIGIMPRP